jgi:hypothetical protein
MHECLPTSNCSNFINCDRLKLLMSGVYRGANIITGTSVAEETPDSKTVNSSPKSEIAVGQGAPYVYSLKKILVYFLKKILSIFLLLLRVYSSSIHTEDRILRRM